MTESKLGRDGFLEQYIENLKKTLDNVSTHDIENIIGVLEKTVKNKSKIYVAGNGGSSTTASHMTNDLGVGLRRRGLVSFDIISLGDNHAVTSAIANDLSFKDIFYMQVEGVLNPQDVVIAISCSGNSPNIIKLVEYANKVGATVVGITGFDGGILKNQSSINCHIETPKNEYGLVEDVHMILNHIIYSYFINCNGR